MSIYDSLNGPQKEAVMHTEGPLLLLAGAGSGKTRVITHRIAYLIEEVGVNGWNILAITFTNKAANEMRERVDRVVDYGADAVWVSTFHSLCVRILRRYIDRLGYDNNFTIYDTDDQKSVIKEVCKKLNIDTKYMKERTIMGAISHAKDELIGPDEMEMNAGNDYHQKKIAQVYREYQKQLKLNNAVDFDDLIVLTVELFRTQPEVLEYYQERFKYIMVDEYQDTNTAQFKLVSILAQKYQNLCVVGDDDQSIYKFRGANISNILNFEKIFPETTVIRLEQNYRSTQNILDVANFVIKNNQARKTKTLWTANDEGDKIEFIQYETAYEEADGVVGAIRQKVRDGYNYNDIAVLYRTNAQARILEEKFVNMNVPYKVFGGVNFYARKEIKDILAYLKTLDNGKDGQAVKRIINVPKRGIGATTIEKVQTMADQLGISFFEALTNDTIVDGLGRSAAKVKPFVTYILALRTRMQSMSLKELVETIIEETNYIEYLGESDTEDELEARQENIEELINKVITYEENCEGEPSLSEFLEEVSLVADIDNLDESNDRVVLMTLHSAKGLEFPIVYMTGLEDGLFPSYMSIMSDDGSDVEEERRLFYVGVTRAMKELHLTAAKLRMQHGETQVNKPSRFIKEMPQDRITMLGAKKKAVNLGSQETPAPAVKPKLKPFAGTTMADLKTGAQLAASSSAASLEYGVGDRVRHIKFGDGTVIDIKSGGRDYEVTVEFDEAGTKKMFASFAKLKKL